MPTSAAQALVILTGSLSPGSSSSKEQGDVSSDLGLRGRALYKGLLIGGFNNFGGRVGPHFGSPWNQDLDIFVSVGKQSRICSYITLKYPLQA